MERGFSSEGGNERAADHNAVFTFADLFSGIGGFRLAAEAVGGRCVLSSEIDEAARLVYHANFGEWPLGDIRLIQAETVPEHDILCAGFPCQTFSISGRQLGFADETRGTLFFEIARLLRARHPAAAFLENVPNLVKHDSGRSFETIQRVLKECGYDVHWQMLNASLFGASTARKRIYIVAIRSDLGVPDFRFPEPTHEPVKLGDVLLPDAETGACVVRNRPIHIDLDAVARAEGNVALGLVPVGWVGEPPIRQGYLIYSPWGHSSTFMHRGGGVGAESGNYYIHGVTRRLHPREMARAMGIPDSFVIPSSVSSAKARGLIGNSVVVPVIRLIAERIVSALRLQAERNTTLAPAVNPEMSQVTSKCKPSCPEATVSFQGRQCN
jgi:DNA (cytosine-5)-methyltransferase 1